MRNGSDEPVYAGTLTWAKAIDGTEVTNEGFGALGPGQTKKFQTPDNLHLIHGTAVAIRFRDASGVTWERDSNGILTESP